jgi:hypothetical protein
LISVGRRISGWELQVSTAFGGSFSPVVDVVGFLALLSTSSVDFRFRLLSSRNSSLDGGTVIVDLAVTLWRRSLWGLPSSSVAPLCTLRTGRYTVAFPFRSWWRFLLVSAMFRTIRVHLEFSPTNSGAYPATQAVMVSIPLTISLTASASGCYMVFSFANLKDLTRFEQSFWNSGVGTLAMLQVTTTITITVNCM